MHEELKKIRKKIDKVDEKLKKQLAEREQLVEKVAKTKQKHGLEIEDPTREEEILSSIKSPFVKKIFTAIIKHSKEAQFKL